MSLGIILFKLLFSLLLVLELVLILLYYKAGLIRIRSIVFSMDWSGFIWIVVRLFILTAFALVLFFLSFLNFVRIYLLKLSHLTLNETLWLRLFLAAHLLLLWVIIGKFKTSVVDITQLRTLRVALLMDGRRRTATTQLLRRRFLMK